MTVSAPPSCCRTTTPSRRTTRSSGSRCTSSSAPRRRCSAAARPTFGAPPNSQVCPTCLGLPGSLPVLNGTAVESAIRIGLALNCEIAEWCRFARKNYFYPDMPKNFQTSQYDEPICFDGYLDVEVRRDDGAHVPRRDRARAHGGGHRQVAARRRRDRPHPRRRLLAGRLQPRRHPADRDRHQADRGHRAPGAGGGPRVRHRAARALRTLGVSDVRMEQGSLRCDVNLSLRPHAEHQLGTRSETKNVNSLRSVERAVRYEIHRQAAVLDAGGRVVQETRHFHEDTGTTTSGPVQGAGRGLPVLPGARPGAGRARRASGWRSCAPTLPPAPAVRAARLQEAWGLSRLRHAVAGQRGRGRPRRRDGRRRCARRAAARKWWLGELARTANERGVDLAALPITPAQVARVVAAGRGRHAQRQAGPPGHRGCARRRGRARRGRGAARRCGSSATTARSSRRSTRRSPPTRTSPRRSAAARSRRPARSSARS